MNTIRDKLLSLEPGTWIRLQDGSLYIKTEGDSLGRMCNAVTGELIYIGSLFPLRDKFAGQFVEVARGSYGQ